MMIRCAHHQSKSLQSPVSSHQSPVFFAERQVTSDKRLQLEVAL